MWFKYHAGKRASVSVAFFFFFFLVCFGYSAVPSATPWDKR